MRTLQIILFIIITLQLHGSKKELNSEYEQFITVNIFSSRDQRFIETIKSELSDRIVSFQYAIGRFPDIELVINVAPDTKTYESWWKTNHVIFENSIGFADLNTNQIYIKNPRSLRSREDFYSLLMHEYIHLFIYYYFHDAPLWFHEGMAHYFSSSFNFDNLHYIRTNAFKTGFLLLRYQYQYPDNAQSISPYYFQSFLIFRNIINTTDTSLQNIFLLSEEIPEFNSSFSTVLGMSPEAYIIKFYNEMTSIRTGYRKSYKYVYPLIFIIIFVLIYFAAKWNRKHNARLEEIDDLFQNLMFLCENCSSNSKFLNANFDNRDNFEEQYKIRLEELSDTINEIKQVYDKLKEYNINKEQLSKVYRDSLDYAEKLLEEGNA